MISYRKVAFWGTSYKLFAGSRGEAKENCWWSAQPQFACKQTSFELSLPTKRTWSSFISKATSTSTFDVRQADKQNIEGCGTPAYFISPPWRGGAARHAHKFDGIFFPISDLRRNFSPPSNTSETIFNPLPTGRYVCLCTCVYRKCVPVPSLEFWSIYFVAFATNFCPLEILFAVLFDFTFSKYSSFFTLSLWVRKNLVVPTRCLPFRPLK